MRLYDLEFDLSPTGARPQEPRCTCPGWCYFNPGEHHVNCKCEACKAPPPSEDK